MTNSNHLNPWYSMWRHPKVTVQQIIDSDDPERWVLLLAALSGIYMELIDKAFPDDTNVQMPSLIMALIFGPLKGVILLYFSGMLYSWTGKWIEGKASAKDVRVAFAWAQIPLVWSLMPLILVILIFGEDLFLKLPRNSYLSEPPYNIFLFTFIGFNLIATSFYVFILPMSLGQVQGFSAWKAIWNMFIPLLVVVLAMLLYYLI